MVLRPAATRRRCPLRQRLPDPPRRRRYRPNRPHEQRHRLRAERGRDREGRRGLHRHGVVHLPRRCPLPAGGHARRRRLLRDALDRHLRVRRPRHAGRGHGLRRLRCAPGLAPRRQRPRARRPLRAVRAADPEPVPQRQRPPRPRLLAAARRLRPHGEPGRPDAHRHRDRPPDVHQQQPGGPRLPLVPPRAEPVQDGEPGWADYRPGLQLALGRARLPPRGHHRRRRRRGAVRDRHADAARPRRARRGQRRPRRGRRSPTRS